MLEFITTRDVCQTLDISEPALRHLLRREGAPRPRLHPSARLFLWTEEDVADLKSFACNLKLEARREVESAS